MEATELQYTVLKLPGASVMVNVVTQLLDACLLVGVMKQNPNAQSSSMTFSTIGTPTRAEIS